jgi:dolichyl-phosphate-mannose-protein mannosyltransferase
LLIKVALSRQSTSSAAARRAIFLVPLALALALRAHQALATPDVLDWDETYYLSTAVTAAAGHGLYPYVLGYGPMPIAGGLGYVAYVYALAVRLLGPSIYSLRLMSLLASVLALAGVWRLVKIWYGSGAAWIATAIAASTSLFLLSNTVRMDGWTLAGVAWALVVFAWAMERWHRRAGHLLAGLAFGACLQVHPDVTATALACGFVSLVFWIGDALRARRFVPPLQPLLFLAGWSLGLLAFVASNVLPDPETFYRTTMLVRVDATSWYSPGTSSAIGSFLDPRILIGKESARYDLLASVVAVLEAVLFGAAMIAALVRRNAADRVVLLLVPAVFAGTALVLNNASPLYFIHVAPALLVPLGPLFSHGFTGRAPVTTAHVRGGSLVAFAIAIAALSAVNDGPLLRALTAKPPDDAAARAVAERVRAVAEPRCKIAGDAGLYVRYFADYPYFVSARPTEVHYGMLYFGSTSEANYWAIKRPDVVFGSGPLPAALAGYVSSNGLSERAPQVWVRRDGCAGGP